MALAVLASGVAVRCYYTLACYLNPDEALHFDLAHRDGLGQAYAASLLQAHPPLLTFVLHMLLRLGCDEWLLRLPSCALGSAAVWIAFLWMRNRLGSAPALAGLGLLTWSPAMLSTATEARQYGLLLFFLCAALYSVDRALSEQSASWMGLFSVALYGAILSHYTAAWVCLVLGVEVLTRVWLGRPPRRVVVVWTGGQVGALLLYAALYTSHLAPLRAGAMATWAVTEWLKDFYYSPHRESLAGFVARTLDGAFAFAAGGKPGGRFLFLLFVAGVGLKFARPGSRGASLLLVLPLTVGCAGAVARLLPFGESRHVTYLLPFIAAGAGLGLAALVRHRLLPLAVAGLLLGPLWPLVSPPANQPRALARHYMSLTVRYLGQHVPRGSLVVVDYQTRLVFRYYLGRSRPRSPEEESPEGQMMRVGGYRLVSSHKLWRFESATLVSDAGRLARSFGAPPGAPTWIASVRWHGGEPLVTPNDARLVHGGGFGDIVVALIRTPVPGPRGIESPPRRKP